MRKPTSVAKSTPVRVVVVTMDSHLGGAMARAADTLRRELPGLELTMHAADEWGCDPDALKLCTDDIARADIVVATMLFLDEHVRAVMPALVARRDACDAMVCCLSAGEIVKLTRVGRFDMSKEAGGALAWLKRLRGSSKDGTSGQGQMKTLKQLPKLLRFVPGTAQDVRAYFLALQYWLAGSEENLTNMVRLLVDRYCTGTRKELHGALKVAPPIVLPPRMNLASQSPSTGTRPACWAATTTDHAAVWSHRSNCPVKPIPKVNPSKSTPVVQFISRGNL